MEKRVFEFTNYNVPVKIAGHDFTLNCNSDTGDYLKAVGEGLKNLSAEMSAGTKTKDDAIVYGRKVIDHLLGTGAAEKVLANSKNGLSDITDICLFLTETAAVFRNERRKLQGGRQDHPHPSKKKKRNG